MVDTKEYIEKIKQAFPLPVIKGILDDFEGKKVLVVGDTIIDEYCFVEPKGRAMKDPMLSVEYLSEETYAGGILAIANHVSNFVKDVTVLTLLGDRMDYKDLILTRLKKNVKPVFFVKKDAPTTKKKRYINNTRKEKLFKIEYINDHPIDRELEAALVNFLERELPSFDLVLVGDFGHGFINEKIIDALEKKARYLAVNAQTNSANMGFNYITRYNKPSFVAMDGSELRHAIGDRFNNHDLLMHKLHEQKGFNNFLVTLGKEGAAYFNQRSITRAPSMASKVLDVVGAGDAVFSIISLFAHHDCDEDLIPFIANCAGGVAVNIMGNKESVTKEALLDFIEKTYKSVEEGEINQYINAVNSALGTVDKGHIAAFVQILLDAYHNDKVIYIFGNGGSAATASHFCGDLVKGVSYGLEKRFKVICLNDNTPSIMAIANDISYDAIFVEQLKNFLREGDVVIGISGSGNSTNVVKALEYANSCNAKTVAICGYKGGKIKEISHLAVHAEIDDMEISEDIHNLIITHCAKRMLTKELNSTHLGEVYEKRVA